MAYPVLVPPLGYRIRLTAVRTCPLRRYRLKSKMSRGLDENKTTPIRVCPLLMLNRLTIALTKLRHRRKFPLPYASILPEPSMTKAKSTRARQPKKKHRRNSDVSLDKHWPFLRRTPLYGNLNHGVAGGNPSAPSGLNYRVIIGGDLSLKRTNSHDCFFRHSVFWASRKIYAKINDIEW